MRVSVSFSDVSHVRLERIDMGDGPWHKIYVTDTKGVTDEILIFGHHNWPARKSGGAVYDDVGFQGFDPVDTREADDRYATRASLAD